MNVGSIFELATRSPFWRGETGAAWEFPGSDGSAGAPWLGIHFCRCGLAFTVCLGVVTPVAPLHHGAPRLHHGAPRCDGCFTPRQTV